MRAASTRRSIWQRHDRIAISLWLPVLLQSGAASGRDELPGLTAATVVAQAEAAPKRTDFEELLLEVDINGQGLADTTLVLRAPDGALYLEEGDLRRWRLRMPAGRAYRREGASWYPLGEIPGARYRLDPVRQTLAIDASPEAFITTQTPVGPGLAYPAPILPQPGGFVNYNVSLAHGQDSTIRSGLFETGLFSRYGAFDNSVLAPGLPDLPPVVRLESTYVTDFPERLATLRLGDSIDAPGAWGLPVRFGGIQYGTNFATQPGFIRSPLSTTASGLATLPSVVDVFVNNALVSRRSVPPGPFSLTNVPIVSGSGDVRIVVRDLLGREQILTQPFYGATALLKEGLQDFSYEAGKAREDFGAASNHYGPGLAAATYRRGLSDSVTGELRGEHTEGTTALGASTNVLVDGLGLVTATGAGSQGSAGTGHLVGYGLERQSRTWSYSLQTQMASSGFRQIGLAPDQPARSRQTSANVGFQMGELGSVSLTYVLQAFRGQSSVELASLAYSVPVGKAAQLAVTLLKVFGDAGGNTVFATLAIPLGLATSASVGVERDDNRVSGRSRSTSFALQKSLPVGEGYGYRLQARDRDTQGTLAYQNNVGTYQLDAAHTSDGATATRLGAAGGFGFVGGHGFFSRAITESFGVVRVADYPNVRVLHDNQVAATTDARGYAVLPRLRAYDRNAVSIDQSDLPLDAVISSSRLVAVPYFRSGVLLDFPVRRARGATLRLILEDGTDMPAGALARFQGRAEEFPVALRGEVYLNGFEASNRVVVAWKRQECVIEISYPDTSDPLPDLGTFVCKGVRP